MVFVVGYLMGEDSDTEEGEMAAGDLETELGRTFDLAARKDDRLHAQVSKLALSLDAWLAGAIERSLEQLTIAQEKGTDLVEENRKLRLAITVLREELAEARARLTGIVLPGWTCSGCGAFSGTEKEALTACRVCGAPRAA